MRFPIVMACVMVACSSSSEHANQLAVSLEQRAPGCYEVRDSSGQGPYTFGGFFSGIVELDTTPSAKYKSLFRIESTQRELRTHAVIPDSAAIDTALNASSWRMRGADTLELSRLDGHNGTTILLTEGPTGLRGIYSIGGDVLDPARPWPSWSVTARRVDCPARAVAP